MVEVPSSRLIFSSLPGPLGRDATKPHRLGRFQLFFSDREASQLWSRRTWIGRQCVRSESLALRSRNRARRAPASLTVACVWPKVGPNVRLWGIAVQPLFDWIGRIAPGDPRERKSPTLRNYVVFNFAFAIKALPKAESRAAASSTSESSTSGSASPCAI
jgi:hypothetical protein